METIPAAAKVMRTILIVLPLAQAWLLGVR
jgi:hypothetical protein